MRRVQFPPRPLSIVFLIEQEGSGTIFQEVLSLASAAGATDDTANAQGLADKLVAGFIARVERSAPWAITTQRTHPAHLPDVYYSAASAALVSWAIALPTHRNGRAALSVLLDVDMMLAVHVPAGWPISTGWPCKSRVPLFVNVVA